jgi:hypothetical protein
MKKGIITFLTLLAGIVNASADNVVTVKDVTVPQGMKATIAVELNNSDDITAFQMDLTLPDDITFVSAAKSDRFAEDHTFGSTAKGQTITFASFSQSNLYYAGNSGTLFTVSVSADEGLAVGTELTATLSKIEVTKLDGASAIAINPEDVTFKITIGEPIVELDENATTLPEAADNVNVRVLRSFNANEWGTICLPFAMTEAQTKAAFGDGVKLGDFVDYDTEEDVNEDIVGITVNFDEVSAIEANHPYVIKPTKSITQFIVEGVDIAPEPDDAIVIYDNGLTGKKQKIYATFEGTLVANTAIDVNNIIISGGKFRYVTDATQPMKAFRASLWLSDELSIVAGARINISFDSNTTTGIENHRMTNDDDRYYNVNGQRIQNPKKGLYIKGNKKVVIK